jgi:hypothetical protein
MQTETQMRSEMAHEEFSRLWGPHWYGSSFWRWLTRRLRVSEREHCEQYFVVGYLTGPGQQRKSTHNTGDQHHD